MKSLVFLLVVLVSAAASAAKNPFPVLASCNLILYDGASTVQDSKKVVLPAFEITPSADLLLAATRKGRTYIFSGNVLRNNGTDYLSLTLSKFVGDAKVELVNARAPSPTRFEPGVSVIGIYHILEADKKIGYFGCEMKVQPTE